jgi:hypothetical protein
MLRSLRLGGLIVLSIGSSVGIGCRSATQGPIVTVTQVPDFRADSLKSVAYLGMGSSVADPRAAAMMEPAVQRELVNARLPFILVRLDEVERRVNITDTGETYRAVRDYWRDAKKLDKFRAAELCAKLGVDGLLLGTVVDWMQTEVAPGTQQISTTKVIARLCLYPAGAGRPAWQVQVSHVMESSEREQVSGDPYTQTARQRELQRSPGVQARERGPAAPGFDEVVEVVAQALVEALAP